MTVKTPHEQRLELWVGVIDAMREEQQQLLSDLIISGLIVYLAAFHGANPTFSVGVLGVVNTISVGQLYKAFREVQAENREEYTDET